MDIKFRLYNYVFAEIEWLDNKLTSRLFLFFFWTIDCKAKVDTWYHSAQILELVKITLKPSLGWTIWLIPV
jgi:hypothetical protein